MAAEPVKSQPLHNFSLAHLKWGHRSHHSFRRRDSPPSAAELNANTVQRRPSPPSGESGPKVPSPGSLPEFPFSVCSTQKRHGEEGETKAWKLRPRKARNDSLFGGRSELIFRQYGEAAACFLFWHIGLLYPIYLCQVEHTAKFTRAKNRRRLPRPTGKTLRWRKWLSLSHCSGDRRPDLIGRHVPDVAPRGAGLLPPLFPQPVLLVPPRAAHHQLDLCPDRGGAVGAFYGEGGDAARVLQGPEVGVHAQPRTVQREGARADHHK
nr:uncharacterized protein LOC109169067 isoform X2 [Ipomoea trifida]